MMMRNEKTAGYQRWADLTFLHWRVPAACIQPLLPKGLIVETFDGSAWIGLVPFSMERVRPWWSPPVPGISWFLETNVRTYVQTAEGQSGVWFFSLDANSRLAVTIARNFWNLPYFNASLALVKRHIGGTAISVQYSGQRLPYAAVNYNISFELPPGNASTAQPGTLEHFLLERYRLFCVGKGNRLYSGQVHHAPYQFQSLSKLELRQSMVETMVPGLELSTLPDHAVFSTGVDVRISPIQRLS